MKPSFPLCYGLLMLISLSSFGQLSAADETVTGNLSVTGQMEIQGSTLNIGGGTNNATSASGSPGFLIESYDAAVGTLYFRSLREAGGQWSWSHANSSGPDDLQLTLDAENLLSLYNPTDGHTAKIVFDPDSADPHITVGGSRVLTVTAANALYLSGSASSLTLGSDTSVSGGATMSAGYNNTASGQYSFALGHDNTASSDTSFALGIHNVASGGGSIAGNGGTKATADWSVALNIQTTSSGWASMAIGNNCISSGSNSFAGGQYSESASPVSFAFGRRTVTLAPDMFGVGAYNTCHASGDLVTLTAQDTLFCVGNGSGEATRSNAFEVQRNGDATVGHNLTVQANLSVAGVITTQPQGDIPMGDFTAQPTP